MCGQRMVRLDENWGGAYDYWTRGNQGKKYIFKNNGKRVGENLEVGVARRHCRGPCTHSQVLRKIDNVVFFVCVCVRGRSRGRSCLI